MPRLCPVSAKKAVKMLQHFGFQEIRVKGSHHFFFNSITKKTATVPIHGKEDLSIGILKEILRDIGLSIEEYEKARREI